LALSAGYFEVLRTSSDLDGSQRKAEMWAR
jgi:hypothetical protein